MVLEVASRGQLRSLQLVSGRAAAYNTYTNTYTVDNVDLTYP